MTRTAGSPSTKTWPRPSSSAFSSLCDLVRAYSTDPKVADDLCAKLDQAAAASTTRGREGLLGAFAGQVDAKTDKGLTPAQAAELKFLAGLL